MLCLALLVLSVVATVEGDELTAIEQKVQQLRQELNSLTEIVEQTRETLDDQTNAVAQSERRDLEIQYLVSRNERKLYVHDEREAERMKDIELGAGDQEARIAMLEQCVTDQAAQIEALQDVVSSASSNKPPFDLPGVTQTSFPEHMHSPSIADRFIIYVADITQSGLSSATAKGKAEYAIDNNWGTQASTEWEANPSYYGKVGVRFEKIKLHIKGEVFPKVGSDRFTVCILDGGIEKECGWFEGNQGSYSQEIECDIPGEGFKLSVRHDDGGTTKLCINAVWVDLEVKHQPKRGNGMKKGYKMMNKGFKLIEETKENFSTDSTDLNDLYDLNDLNDLNDDLK